MCVLLSGRRSCFHVSPLCKSFCYLYSTSCLLFQHHWVGLLGSPWTCPGSDSGSQGSIEMRWYDQKVAAGRTGVCNDSNSNPGPKITFRTSYRLILMRHSLCGRSTDDSHHVSNQRHYPFWPHCDRFYRGPVEHSSFRISWRGDRLTTDEPMAIAQLVPTKPGNDEPRVIHHHT